MFNHQVPCMAVMPLAKCGHWCHGVPISPHEEPTLDDSTKKLPIDKHKPPRSDGFDFSCCDGFAHGHGGTVAFHGRNGGRPGVVSHEFGWYSRVTIMYIWKMWWMWFLRIKISNFQKFLFTRESDPNFNPNPIMFQIESTLLPWIWRILAKYSNVRWQHPRNKCYCF